MDEQLQIHGNYEQWWGWKSKKWWSECCRLGHNLHLLGCSCTNNNLLGGVSFFHGHFFWKISFIPCLVSLSRQQWSFSSEGSRGKSMESPKTVVNLEVHPLLFFYLLSHCYLCSSSVNRNLVKIFLLMIRSHKFAKDS